MDDVLHVRLIVRVVVKLFNAIQQSQAASAAAAEELKTHRGTGKPTLPAPAILDRKKKGKQKDNIIGRGKEGKSPDCSMNDVLLTVVAAPLAQDDFLDIIRSGGIVSKA